MALKKQYAVRRLESARKKLAEARRIESKVFKLKAEAGQSMRKVLDEIRDDEMLKEIAINSGKVAFGLRNASTKDIKIDVRNGTIFAVLNFGDWLGPYEAFQETQKAFRDEFEKQASEYLGIPADYIGTYISAKLPE